MLCFLNILKVIPKKWSLNPGFQIHSPGCIFPFSHLHLRTDLPALLTTPQSHFHCIIWKVIVFPLNCTFLFTNSFHFLVLIKSRPSQNHIKAFSKGGNSCLHPTTHSSILLCFCHLLAMGNWAGYITPQSLHLLIS